MKDIIKDIVVHVIELALGLFVALYIYDETRPVEEYPDYSRELNRASVELRNVSKAIYDHEMSLRALADTIRADMDDWRDEQKELDRRRFLHYLNN